MNGNDITDVLNAIRYVAGNTVAIIGALAVLAGASAVALRRSPRGATWFAVQPLRSAARRLERRGPQGSGVDRPYLSGSELRSVHRAVIGEMKRQLRSGSDSDVALFAWSLLTAANPRVEGDPRPYDSSEFRAVSELLTEARSPELRGLFVHYQVPELWAECESRLEACAAYMQPFVDVRPVWSAPSTASVRAFATAFTGAAVLADGCDVQGGVLGSTHVFHRGRWHGPASSETQAAARRAGLTPYDAFHRSGHPHEMDSRRIGQYDGRVPSLVSVSVVERPARAGVQVVLVTDETCYATTEPPAGNPAAGNPAYECKRLMPAGVDEHMGAFRQPHEGSWTFERAERNATRTVLLNVVLGLLAAPTGELPSLVFAIRSAEVRNGAGGLAPAAGGVIELPAGHAPKDADQFGCVDPRAGVIRECREELGLVPDADSLAPAAVFLSTTRTRPLATGQREPRLDTGELVASILFLGSTDLDIERIRDSARRADPLEGAYESRGFVAVSLTETAEEFVGILRAARFNGREIVGPESREGGEPLLDCLGQSGVLTCLYASARVHGPGEAVAAFASLSPWWIDDWAEALPMGASRICRGFDSWLGLQPEQADVLLKTYWPHLGVDDLHERLRRP